MLRLRRIGSNLHYACTAALAILAVPLIVHLHLPLHLNLGRMITFYRVGLGSKSIFRSLIFALLPTIDALFVLELVERARTEGESPRGKLAGVFAAAAYLFVGISLVLVYNDIIIASRLPVSYDNSLNQIEMHLLHGGSVSGIAHTMFRVLPPQVLRFLDFAYFQMFLVVGGAFLVCSYYSLRLGLQFAGTCLTAYYLALLIFFIWPTYGPYFFCADHLARYPQYLTTYQFHKAGIAALAA